MSNDLLIRVPISEGKVVSLAYHLKDSSGETLDQSSAADPFVYLHGAGQIVPGLEAGIEGLKKGDSKNVVVEPSQGYGEIDQALVMKVKKTQFPEGAEIEEGMQFEASNGQGHVMVFTVNAINGDEVEIDGNHPLAGETLHFAVEVIDVRDATEDERSHGHAHGPDGHHHH